MVNLMEVQLKEEAQSSKLKSKKFNKIYLNYSKSVLLIGDFKDGVLLNSIYEQKLEKTVL